MNPEDDATAAGEAEPLTFEQQMQALHDQTLEQAAKEKAKREKDRRKNLEIVGKVQIDPTKAEPKALSKPDEQRQLEFPYSHERMIDLFVAHPSWSHRQYAEHFGFTPSWFSAVLASDDFQLALDPRRKEVVNPSLTATLEERFRSLTLRSLDVLQDALGKPGVQDATVLKAAEIGIKALGLGQRKGTDDDKPPAASSLDTLADRLTSMLAAKGLGSSGLDHRTQQEIMTIEAMTPSEKSLHELKEFEP